MQQQGGSHYGAPPPPPAAAEAVPPISSRPPQPLNFDELATAVSGSFPEDDAVAGPGDRSGGTPGNRWPRHETLALIRIRSDMDAAFREAALKGPLWEEVSRKLKEQGITRSSKKCKEKFENVHKYYKRTKEGRAGRQDGKNYRFFSELEALTGGAAAMNAPSRSIQPTPIASIPPPPSNTQPTGEPAAPATIPPLCGLGFSSNSESDPDSETEDDGGGRKRKRQEAAGSGRHTMALFGEMMRKVMEQQEAMQQRFLDVIEKREQERMARDEAWRRQEAARLSREHDMAAQERSMAASRDAAIIAFLQKISDQNTVAPTAAPPLVSEPLPKPTIQIQQELPSEMPAPPPPPPPPTHQEPLPVVRPPPGPSADGGMGDPPSSRWPKTEVLTLIELRCALDMRYHDSGPKGPLWEEISAGMRRLGYNRNAKRCKEKWENINKYFKKVKESNKKRPDDAKTCPYFHQLDAIYRSRSLGAAARANALPIASLPPPPPDAKSNGLIAPPTAAGAPEKKAEDSVMTGGAKEAQNHRQSSTALASLELHDSASMSGHDDDDYDDEEDDEEEAKMAYKIEFQRPNITGAAASNATGPNPPAGVPPAATGPFLAMVQ